MLKIVPLKLIVTFLFIGSCAKSLCSVSPKNPFLRPGSNKKPPPPKALNVNQTFPKKDMSKEIEFRGYFVLKGQPFFCLFNKKSNHAEWIGISELTYEEFKAESFDLDSEILTVLYEGTTYELSLLQGGSSSGAPPLGSPPKQASAGPSIARTPQAPTNSASPKYMPPRPKTTPTLPDWLVNRKVSPAAPSGNSNLTSSGSYPGSVPRRTFPNTPSFGSGTRAVQSPSEDNNGQAFLGRSNSASNTPSSDSTFSNKPPTLTGSNVIEQTDQPSSESVLDLENLPPPPPPPNITPPTPPPNILPAREN